MNEMNNPLHSIEMNFLHPFSKLISLIEWSETNEIKYYNSTEWEDSKQIMNENWWRNESIEVNVFDWWNWANAAINPFISFHQLNAANARNWFDWERKWMAGRAAFISISFNSALANFMKWMKSERGKRWLFHVTASSLITHQWIVSLFVADEVTFTITVIISFLSFIQFFSFMNEKKFTEWTKEINLFLKWMK